MFVKTMLRYEIIPVFKDQKKLIMVSKIENCYYHSSIDLSLIDQPNLASQFAKKVAPCIIRHYEQNRELPEKLVFAFACMIHCYKNHFYHSTTPIKSTCIIGLMYNLWSVKRQKIDSYHTLVYTILSCESHWKINLNEIPGLAETITQRLIRLEKVSFEFNISDIIGRVYT